MKLRLTGLGAAIALMSFISNASAVVTYDTDLVSGWTNGSGTVNGHFTVDTENDGVELGLRAAVRFVGPITPTGNVYQAQAGTALGRALWNFEFSVNPGTLTGTHACLPSLGQAASSPLTPV